MVEKPSNNYCEIDFQNFDEIYSKSDSENIIAPPESSIK